MRTWSFFHNENWIRKVRKWILRTIRTATRRLVPSLPVLLLLASIAAVIVANVRVKAIP